MSNLRQDWYRLIAVGNRSGGIGYFTCIGIFLLGLNLYAPAPPTILQRVLASATAVLAFGVIWLWVYRADNEAEIGFLPIMTVVYFLEYPFTIFTQKFYQMNFGYGEYLLSNEAVDKALALSLIGLPMIVLGFYWPGRKAIAEKLPRFQMKWRDRDVVEFMAVGFAIMSLATFLIAFRIKLSDATQAYLSLPGEFFFLSLATLFILQLQGQLSFASKVLMWGVLIPLRVVLGMSQGTLALGMVVVMALAITYATIRRRVPWIVFIIGFGGFVVLQPVKGDFRKTVFLKGTINKDEPQSEKLAAFMNSAEVGWSVVQSFDLKDVVSIATARLSDILIFATVVERTPQDTPYWYGASFYRLLFFPIPRILYPEKPNYLEGNVLGHQYAMIGDDDYVTSINLAQLIELYGNFGPPGVIFGCLVFGIIYRTIHDCFVHPSCGLGSLVTGIYFFTHLIDIENSTASIFGGLLLESIVVLIFFFSIRLAEEFCAGARLRLRSAGSQEKVLATSARYR